MKRSLFITACGVFALTGWACAQTQETPTPKVSLPPGPLVITKMPNFAQWSIDYTYPRSSTKPGEAPSQPPRLVRVIVTRTGSVIHEQRAFDQGQSGELWSTDKYVIERKPNAPKPVATIKLESNDDFPDFDGVSKDNFIEIKTHDDRKCLVFSNKVYTTIGDYVGTATVYVDFETRFPEGYEINGKSRKYTILPSPTVELVVPGEYLEAANAMMYRINQATPHLGGPP
jgi:hypothetical protein